MSEKRWLKKDTISIIAAASKLKIKSSVLKEQINCGNIESRENRIHKSDFEKIQHQKNEYISLTDFIKQHNSERFIANLISNRNKYIDFLEANNYFGVQLFAPDKILFSKLNDSESYIKKEDIGFLNFKSIKFFDEFGFTEKEKIYKLIHNKNGHKVTMKLLNNFIEYFDDGSNKFTPTMTSFVEIIFAVGDARLLTDNDVVSILEECNAVRTKKLVVDYLNFVREFEQVKYSKIELIKSESNPIPAYSYHEFVKLAKILFNSEYDHKNNLTKKALANCTYAQMWLFLAIHFICGWRASDICTNWVYPNLRSDDNPFRIKLGTLSEDILTEKIDNKVYESIALYAIKKIELSFNLPSKSSEYSPGKLRSEIVPNLRVFFGKLILIAEFHQLNSNDGYMKTYRINRYCNWTYCRDFFGEEMYLLSGRHNLSSRKLNKSYLQGIEQAAKDNGNTCLVAHTIASLARNHTNIETTALYLNDHGLTGENADVVLFMMMQRGVFSVSLYHLLLSAYPESFKKLTSKDQSELMEKIPLSAYEVETMGTVLIATEKVANEFAKGKTKEPIEILKAMYAIGQGHGKSKDEGVFCIKRALGKSCTYPLFESCLANLCEYHVFTNSGIQSLINVIKNYSEKAHTSGNKKYEIVLYKKIVPAFQEIINEIIMGMSKKEKESVKFLISGALNE